MKKRPYRMRRRAEEQERTRQKIVEAAAALHGSVGPGDTTISAVAEKAGVQRLTVYRHFPDEKSLFGACSSHWLGLNPPPDVADWQHLTDPAKRAAAALRALYVYYSRTASMWTLVYRDVDRVPAMQEPLDQFHAHLDRIGSDLLRSLQPKGRKSRKLKAAAGHVLSFSTWSSLDRLQLGDREKVDLVLRWLASS